VLGYYRSLVLALLLLNFSQQEAAQKRTKPKIGKNRIIYFPSLQALSRIRFSKKFSRLSQVMSHGWEDWHGWDTRTNQSISVRYTRHLMGVSLTKPVKWI